MNRLLAAAALCLATVPSARVAAEVIVAPPQSWLDKLLEDVHERVDAAIIAKPPKLVPPKPVRLGTKLGKLGTLDIGGSLAALAAGDLDGDGKAELYAVTSTELVAVGVDGKPGKPGKPRILSRVGFSGAARSAPPRDVVASIVLDGPSIYAAASPWDTGIVAVWKNGALVATPLEYGFPQCANEYARLAPGRNYYDEAPSGTYGKRCSSNGAVDNEGYPMRAQSKLSTQNKLEILVERCAAVGLGCAITTKVEHTSVGIAYEIADLDHDGTLELASAGAVAPGEPDALRIVTLGGDEKKPKLKRGVAGGGIAGIVYADIDGNGSGDLVVAVRALGSPKIELWRLE